MFKFFRPSVINDYNDYIDYKFPDYNEELEEHKIATIAWITMIAASSIVLSLIYCYFISCRRAEIQYQPVIEASEYKGVSP